MHRKCDGPSSDFIKNESLLRDAQRPDWRILDRLTDHLYIVSRTQHSHARYASLYIHSFRLCAPRKYRDATRINQAYREYGEIRNVADRLRWCRHSRGLMQAEVADQTGMSLHTYKELEKGALQRVQLETMERLAILFDVPLMDLLDEFNRFCYDGQAARIRAYRESCGLDMKTFAEEKGIPLQSLRRWESGGKEVSPKSWERYFKGRA